MHVSRVSIIKGFAPVWLVLTIAVVGVAAAVAWWGNGHTWFGEVRPTPTPTPQADIRVNLADGWTYQLAVCGVSMPIPPKKAPYYLDRPRVVGNHNDDALRYWHYSFGPSQVGLPGYLFTTNVSADFRADGESGSGFRPGTVSVACADNTKGWTTEQLYGEYEKTTGSGQQATSSLSDKQTITRWGRPVISVQMEGGIDSMPHFLYILATPKHIYMIESIVMSTNSPTQKTAAAILDGIKFID